MAGCQKAEIAADDESFAAESYYPSILYDILAAGSAQQTGSCGGNSMLHLKKGSIIEQAASLKEEYQNTAYGYIANIGVGKLMDVFRLFIMMQQGKMFFFLELPTNESEEKKLRKNPSDPFHRDVYYIDGLTGKEAFALMHQYGNLLFNDGLVRFGFGAQNNSAEIMSDKYNIVLLQTNEPERYASLFSELSIPHTEKITTAFDVVSDDSPGKSIIIETGGIDIFDLPKELEEWGIYFYERKEE